MRVALVHNPKAGAARSVEQLVQGLRDVGWEVTSCHATAELAAVDSEADAVVAAGGDGTVGKVAKHLAGTDTPFAIIPMGTANNVARTLGIGVDAKTAVNGLERASERLVDLGFVTDSRGKEEFFLEGFGMGVFARLIGEKRKTAKKNKDLPKALVMLADEIEGYAPEPYTIEIDGVDHSGEFLLVAAMNMRSFGPALTLAPEAKCDDGELDVVLVREEHRESFVRHLRRAAKVGDITMPQFDVVRGKHIVVRGDLAGHADDRAREIDGEIRIGVAEGAVRVIT